MYIYSQSIYRHIKMLSIHNFVIIFTAISVAISGAKRIKWHLNPVFMFFSIMNLVAEILTQVFIAYKFPVLFVSWIIISDPLFQDIIKYLYKCITSKIKKEV